ncbi:hypothetical protein OIV83_000374 [Microbotryomycetes sp. JL201]|nr:hypothetical protein OIV83_000374 [Microbotryomycetes sp. JL201]
MATRTAPFSTFAARNQPQASTSKHRQSETTRLLNKVDGTGAAALGNIVRGAAEAQSDPIDSALAVDMDAVSTGTITRHLSDRQVISPRHLSPHYLLKPYLPRPDMSLAYPLGPPKSEALKLDPFVRLNVDPLKDGVLNPYIKTQFTTSMGKINTRGKTGLQRKSQRKVAKAIRRARSMGVMPYFGQSLPGVARKIRH